MKGWFARIFPSWWLVIIVKVMLGCEGKGLILLEAMAFALIWTFIYNVFERKPSETSMILFIGSTGVGLLIILNSISSFTGFLRALIVILSGVYLMIKTIPELRDMNAIKNDVNNSRKFVVYNIPEVRRIVRFRNALVDIMKQGANKLGVNRHCPISDENKYIFNFANMLWDQNYEVLRYAQRRHFFVGTSGFVLVRYLIVPGDYEYKDGKWYLDGKLATNITQEIEAVFKKVSRVYGKKRCIILKAFEGGSLKCQGCGYYAMDLTRGIDAAVEEIKKTIGKGIISDSRSSCYKKLSKALRLS